MIYRSKNENGVTFKVNLKTLGVTCKQS
ncbi:hypothetical protein NMT12_50052 [metagenome]